MQKIHKSLVEEILTRHGAMRLTFLGTRGEIDLRSRRHKRHSSLLVLHGRSRLMIDCGSDWLGKLDAVAPTAILLTHAHPDHAGGLLEGAPCPVYATQQTFDLLRRLPIRERRSVALRKPLLIGRIMVRAYRVDHSLRAPAVGFRVSARQSCFFYLPDVANLPDASTALRGVRLYIGDGASVRHPMVRQKDGVWIGHASIATQLGWCATASIDRAIFTHCGSPIVRSDTRTMNRVVRELGRDYGVDASIAYDGDQVILLK